MKIVDLKLERLFGHASAESGMPGGDVGEPVPVEQVYLKVVTDDGLTGIYGPVRSAARIRSELAPHLIGRSPLAGEAIWDEIFRDCFRFGHKNHEFLSALSAVDCALWDLRGKHYDVPVYSLLGGPTRESIRSYASALGFSAEPTAASQQARWLKSQGFTGQKWFFQKRPRWRCSRQDMLKDLKLMRIIREAVGEDHELMFDAVMTWDLEYALAMARRIAEVDPKWLEEPLPANQLGGFVRLKQASSVPLAAGEHLYTRWEVKPYLEAGVLDFVQTDPDWTGGITEMTKICALAAAYGVKVCPHGSHLSAAVQVIASQPEWVCPLLEYLVDIAPRQQHFHKNPIAPVEGHIEVPRQPGLGIELDESKIERREEVVVD